jgi:hypothetical protein
MGWIEYAPLWLIALAMMALLILAHEVGRAFARRARAGAEKREEPGYLVSSALALLGLLMAFTFAAAQERFRLRENLVVAEANSLGTTYLRVELLDAAARGDLGQLLLRYAELRVADQPARPAAGAAGARAQAALQARIWTSLDRALRTNTQTTVDLALINTVNETFDLAAARRAAREQRVPVAVLRTLVFSAMAVALMLGFVGGRQPRQFGVFAASNLLLTLAFCLILDLDRPLSGRVQVLDAPMQRALEAIRQAEAARPAPVPPKPAPASPSP